MDITSYNEITEQTISAIRWPSPYRPTVSYYTDTNFISNNLRGSLWQFAIKYVYYDYTHSVWSPISRVALPLGEEDNEGNWIVDESVNNTILVSFLNGGNLVGEIHIAARDGNGLFQLVKVLNKSAINDDVAEEGALYTYSFRNDSEKTAIPDEEIFRLYDDIPIKARHQEIIDKNIIAYAGVTKGYDPIDIDVSMDYETEEVNALGAITNLNVSVEWLVVGDYYEPDLYEYVVTFPALADYDGLTVRVALPWTSYQITFGAATTNLDVSAIFAAAMTGWVDDGGSIRHQEQYYFEVTGTIRASGNIVIKHPSFKPGSIHPFALAYKDQAGRIMMVLQNDRTKVEVPFYITPLNSVVSINWEIHHRPPEGAKSYQWLYAKNSTVETFFQTIVTGGAITSGVTEIDINAFITDPITGYNTVNTKSILDAYTWQKGDRIRIKAVSATTRAALVPIATYHDFEIESQHEDNIYFRAGTYNIVANAYTLVEVYRPKRTTEGVGIFFEFSPVYDVITENGELYHGGLGDNNQTDSSPAAGVFPYGDVYARVIFSDGNVDNIVFGESELYSNFYQSDVISTGRPVAYDPHQRQVELEQVVHGRRYFETTKINQLFSFHDDDRTAQLPIMFGQITGIRQRGGTLRVYQEKKVSSIYIGAVMVKNADGSNQLVTSDQILGYLDIGKTDYGCAHSTSICTNQKTVYLFDVFNGSFLRDAVNGLFPISGRITIDEYNHDYKMTTYFKEKAQALLDSGLDNTRVYSVWDDVHEIVFVMFLDTVNPNNNEIIGYHEPTNTWCSFYDFSDAYGNFPDCFGSGEQAFVSWLDGVLYRHNSDNVPRCNFYGDQKGCAVRVVSNAVPNIKKYFNALALHTNRVWEVPSIEIPADSSYKRGMFSYLSSAWFKLKRGVFYSAFKRNMKTRQDEETVLDLHNGDKLKGYYAEFDLVQDETTAGEYTELFKVDVEISDK